MKTKNIIISGTNNNVNANVLDILSITYHAREIIRLVDFESLEQLMYYIKTNAAVRMLVIDGADSLSNIQKFNNFITPRFGGIVVFITHLQVSLDVPDFHVIGSPTLNTQVNSRIQYSN